MILPIYVDPHPILRQVTQPVKEITDELRKLVADMQETRQNAQGIGLAAPQIGRSIALCVIGYQGEEEESIPSYSLINPRLTWKSPRQIVMEEACLSIPGLEGPVKRPERVRVKAKDLEGKTFELEAEGLLARVLQHEIDHLNGILFTSHLPKRKLHSRPVPDYPLFTP